MQTYIEGTVVLESRSMHPEFPIHTVVVTINGEINDPAEAVAQKYQDTVKKLREEDK